MRKLWIVTLLLLAIPVAIAQNTTVSATVVDSDSTVWANGSWKLQFYPNPSTPNFGSYKQNGTSLSTSVAYQSGTLNSSGMFSFTTYDSSMIQPAGSGWQLTICPNAVTQCGTLTFSTAGSTMNVSTSITSIIPPPRFHAIAGSYGYTDAEAVVQLIPGNIYWSVTNLCQRIYNGSSWACLGTGSGGGCSTTGILVDIGLFSDGAGGCVGEFIDYNHTNSHVLTIQPRNNEDAVWIENTQTNPDNTVLDINGQGKFQVIDQVADTIVLDPISDSNHGVTTLGGGYQVYLQDAGDEFFYLNFDTTTAELNGDNVNLESTSPSTLKGNGSELCTFATGCNTTFNQIGPGTNTSGAMNVGSGSSLAPTGSGTIQANNIAGTITAGANISITGSCTTSSPCNINAGTSFVGLVQNGSTGSISSDTVVNLTVAYPSTAYDVTLTADMPTGDTGYCSIVSGTKTVTGFTVHANNQTPITCDWVASNVSSGLTAIVTSFNSRTGAVTLNSTDVDSVGTISNNTTGIAANVTATSNSTLATLSALSLPYSQITGTPSVVSNITITVASSTTFNANTCNNGGSATTATMSGLASTNTLTFTPNADISGITGWTPSTSGQLYFTAWPTSNTLNYKVCNPTSSNITTSGATTWNVSAK